ncbi:MAG: hypothetical protein ABI551_00635, partial [Polyangiaceae bacterium]
MMMRLRCLMAFGVSFGLFGEMAACDSSDPASDVPKEDAGIIEADSSPPIALDGGLEASVDPCPAGWICPKKALYNSRVGAWYSAIWRKPGSTAPANEFFPWASSRYKPTMGFYDSDDPVAVAAHLDQMKSAAIDFMIIDGTN